MPFGLRVVLERLPRRNRVGLVRVAESRLIDQETRRAQNRRRVRPLPRAHEPRLAQLRRRELRDLADLQIDLVRLRSDRIDPRPHLLEERGIGIGRALRQM